MPDFREQAKETIRHRLGGYRYADGVLGRASDLVGRGDIIAFSKHRLSKVFPQNGDVEKGGAVRSDPLPSGITASMTAPMADRDARNLSGRFMPSCGADPGGDNLC